MPVHVAVAGSTGSVGTQTLDIVRASPDHYEVTALSAGGASVDLLIQQCREFQPRFVSLADAVAAEKVREAMPELDVSVGDAAIAEFVGSADVVINGVVGFAGLPVTLATLQNGRRLGLANKESLIAAGRVVESVRSTPGAEIVPVDSEHCALHQCLRANESFTEERMNQVASLVLTASGGPFRGRTAADLQSVTIKDALAHPTWAMGPKITIDSSTLMNKGLEVIEANELYAVGFDRIEVVVHPQSVVHSMVSYTDGSTIAQLSMPDMRLCIAYALDYPDRHLLPHGEINWSSLSRLDFEPPDVEAFPCLALAYEAGRRGGGAPATLSAANECAVQAFLDGRIGWGDIVRVVEESLDQTMASEAASLEAVLAVDAEARAVAHRVISSIS